MSGRGAVRLLTKAQRALEGRLAADSRLLCPEAGSARAYAQAMPQEAFDESSQKNGAPQNVKDGKVRGSI